MFLTPETVVLALVFQIFRACGAFFFPHISFYKAFCASVESAVAARESKMTTFLPRLNYSL